jgi:CHRD domain
MLRQLGLLSLAVGLTVAACDDDDETGPTSQTFNASLLGTNERPTPVTTGITGTATMTVNNSTPNTMAWTINVANVPANDTITVAHIHKGVADSAGSIVVDFQATFTRGGNGTTATATGSSAVPDSVFTLISGNRAYVNVHSRRFGGGVTRGQVVRQ